MTENGLEGDRRWALVDGTPNRAGKLLSIRQEEHLMTYRARLSNGSVEVVAPGVNLATVAAFSAEAGMRVDHRRFRANLYVNGFEPAEEAEWLGRRMEIGAVELEAVKRCDRCVVITRDPDTTIASPELLRVLNETQQTYMGVYFKVTRPGSVAAGDQVHVV